MSTTTYKTFNCIECGNENRFRYSTVNKYCNIRCQVSYRWKNVTLPRFYAGEIEERATIRKVLREVRGDKCAVCSITEWNSKSIVFQVDHINGLANDNSPENLRLICANCHSQTPYFGGANKGQGRAALGLRTR